jgi:hypothetical protein
MSATRRKGEPKKGVQEPIGNVNNIKMEKNQPNFPDLNKDGKVTKADILMGRGVKLK